MRLGRIFEKYSLEKNKRLYLWLGGEIFTRYENIDDAIRHCHFYITRMKAQVMNENDYYIDIDIDVDDFKEYFNI